ncbi:divalent cation transporter [Botrimarina sp.]|uniref:ZIP family metal transporter n=1 Tax=Botrimarina sp. TaxID=2795802 RepID=UPI0032EF473B
MGEAATVALLTLAAGAMMVTGAALAHVRLFGDKPWRADFRHGVVAFGGGALLAAVALVLAPEGSRELPIWGVVLSMSGGGVAFMLLSRWLDKSQRPAGQLAAMLADFLPEALALGAAFARGDSSGPLLALLIGLQNLPEGFNAYREMVAEGPMSAKLVLWSFAAMALLGPAAGLTGLWLLSDMRQTVAVIMLVAASGILYLTFEDIAPGVPLKNDWIPPLGAVAGFLFGLIGHMVIG